MTKVIGVRFRTAGKVYFFDPLELEIKRGDHVIVETARGIEFGTVVSGNREIDDDRVIQPLKPVLRIATERDIEQEAANKLKERDAYKVCLEKIQKHGLEMKLIDAEYTFDNNKVLFYFTADGRIDFRELVKDLASVFRTRIELRQIGVRDETKLRGGIGICGRPLCCHSYLSDFIPVSIKMAKEQNLSLNPTKISGVCGRLMCCLKNEEETYEELNRNLPNQGDMVETDDGMVGEVHSVNVLRQLVKVLVEVNDEKELREYEVSKLTFKKRHGKKDAKVTKEELAEMRELERLEREDLEDAKEENEGGNRRKGNPNRGNGQHGNGQHGNRENRENRENRDGGNRENRENRDGGNRENREGGNRENRENREGGNRENREGGNREGGSRRNRNHHNRGNGNNGGNGSNGGNGNNSGNANENSVNANAVNANAGNGGNGGDGGNGGNGGHRSHNRNRRHRGNGHKPEGAANNGSQPQS